MKLITKSTDYAIRALLFAAKKENNHCSAQEVSRSLDIPGPFLRKILRILNKEKLLLSFKGRGGGYKLAKGADKIFIIDIIRIFQGDVKFARCVVGKKPCPDIETCSLKKEIAEIENYAANRFKRLTIKSLLSGG